MRANNRNQSVPKPREYAPPKAPKAIDMASVFEVTPYLLYADAEWLANHKGKLSFEKDLAKYISHEPNIVVGAGPLNALNVQRFARTYRCTLEMYIMRLLTVVDYVGSGFKAPSVTYDSITGFFETPYGILEEPPDTAAIELVSFLLSCHGQIVDITPSSKYGYLFHDITQDEIKEILDPSRLFDLVNPEDPNSINEFHRLLETCKVFSFKRAATEAEATTMEEIEGKLNSQSANDEDNPDK